MTIISHINFYLYYYVWDYIKKKCNNIRWYLDWILLQKIRNTKYRIWNKHILLWWYKSWIRKNEFHHSLNIDVFAMLVMNKKESKKYLDGLMHRRHIAHVRDLERMDRGEYES